MIFKKKNGGVQISSFEALDKKLSGWNDFPQKCLAAVGTVRAPAQLGSRGRSAGKSRGADAATKPNVDGQRQTARSIHLGGQRSTRGQKSGPR